MGGMKVMPAFFQRNYNYSLEVDIVFFPHKLVHYQQTLSTFVCDTVGWMHKILSVGGAVNYYHLCNKINKCI